MNQNSSRFGKYIQLRFSQENGKTHLHHPEIGTPEEELDNRVGGAQSCDVIHSVCPSATQLSPKFLELSKYANDGGQ